MLVNLPIKVTAVAKITTVTTETLVILATKITVERKTNVATTGTVNWVIKITLTSRRFQTYVKVDFHTNTPGADEWSNRHDKSNRRFASATNKRSPFHFFIVIKIILPFSGREHTQLKKTSLNKTSIFATILREV
jgi:hypothetical protein